jgi:mono/diheme cytochrome c family protein
MNRKLFTLLFVLIFSSLILTACSGGGGTSGESPAENTQEAGGEAGETVPSQYAGKNNPMAGNADAAAKGKTTFEANCVSCHGTGGKGDGPAAASLTPKPSNLIDSMKENKVDFIFWRISEGGAMAPFNSAMPAWKDTLSEDERWQIVTYLQTLK